MFGFPKRGKPQIRVDYVAPAAAPASTGSATDSAIRVTPDHYAMLTTIEDHEVFDRVLANVERTFVIRGGIATDMSALVWDLEHLGWAWRPVDSPVWQLTDEGRRARGLPLRPPVPVIQGRSS